MLGHPNASSNLLAGHHSDPTRDESDESRLPIDDLLLRARQNTLPTTLEASGHQFKIQTATRRLEALDQEISRLQSTRNTVRFFRDCNISILAPIRRLPAEVLLSIFALACEDGCTFASQQLMDTPCVPVNISQVSHVWRQLSIETPSLWSRICVLVGAISKQIRDSSELMALCLKRSASSDLSVTVKGWEDSSGSYEPTRINIVDHRMVKLLVDHDSRWKCAYIVLSSVDLLPKSHGNLQKLRVLSLTGALNQTISKHAAQWFKEAHFIERLSLDSIRGNLDLRYNRVNYYSHVLRHFTNTGLCPIAQAHKIVPQARYLDCRNLHRISGLDEMEKRVFHFSHLEEMRICCDSDPAMMATVAPKLRHLRLDDGMFASNITNSMVSVSELLLRSEARLESLTLSALQFPNISSFPTLLNAMEFLKELKLADLKNDTLLQAIYNILNSGSNASVYLPQLQRLTLLSKHKSQRHLSDDAFIEMLESRCSTQRSGMSRLDILTLQIRDGGQEHEPFVRIQCESEELKDRLRRLEREGLVLYFNDDYNPLSSIAVVTTIEPLILQ